MQQIVLGEFLVKDLEKDTSDVGGYISSIQWIVPIYFPLSVLSVGVCRLGRGLGC